MIGGAFTAAAVMSMSDRISGPLMRIYDRMGRVERQAGRLARASATLTKKLLPMAAAAAMVVAAFALTVLSTVETQKALGELGSVGIVQFEAMERAATDFSNRFAGTTKSEFLYAAYDIKSGISSLSDEGVAQFTALAALTAKATKSTVGEMTSLFATGYGIYKGYYADMSDMEFGEMFSAAIAASVQQFKTTGAGMAQAISTLGATATNANVSLQEQAAVLGMLQATMPGAEAGTKYKAFLNAAAAGGKKLGLSFLDANNQLLSLPQILEKMRGKFGPTIDAMEKMKIKKAFGTDEAVAFLDLLYSKTGQLTDGIASVGAAMGAGSGFTEAMAEHMNKDLGAAMVLAGQQYRNLCEIIGGAFAPALTVGFKALSPLLLGLQKLAASPVGKTLLWIAASAAGLILAVTALAAGTWAASAGFAFVKAQLILFSNATKIATAAQWLWNVALNANPIGLVVLGIAAVVGGLALLYSSCEPVRAAMNSMWAWIRGLFDIDLTESGRKLMSTFMDGIRSLISAPVNLVKEGLAAVRNLLPFSDAKEGPLSSLTLSGSRLMTTLGAGIRAAAPALKGTAAQALSGVALAATMAVTPALAEQPMNSVTQAMSAVEPAGASAAAPTVQRPAAQALGGVPRIPALAVTPALAEQPENAAPQAVQAAEPADKSAAASSRASGALSINRLEVVLPGVRDAEGFVAELRRLVETYDVQ